LPPWFGACRGPLDTKETLRHISASSTCPQSFHCANRHECYVCACIRPLCAQHSSVPQSIQYPPADARQMCAGPSRKATRAAGSGLFRPIYLICAISICLHSTSFAFSDRCWRLCLCIGWLVLSKLENYVYRRMSKYVVCHCMKQDKTISHD